MMRITEYEDKVAYFEAAQQMEKYPDAFAPGTAIFKKRPNRRIFTYVIIMQSGHHMSGVIPFSPNFTAAAPSRTTFTTSTS